MAVTGCKTIITQGCVRAASFIQLTLDDKQQRLNDNTVKASDLSEQFFEAVQLL